MQNLFINLRYVLRQFRLSPVFTTAAVLTLALGIGGTTAIFTLIHAVMLRSLPVTDPARLYRVGEGNDCCVEGGPQNVWGMYPYSLYERLKTETPEFEEVAAFQAGLQCRHFFKLGRLCFQTFVQRIGIHAPHVLGTAFHAAIIALANAVEPRRISNRQRAQHHCMDQRKYCRGSANSQSQREHSRSSKNRG